MNLGYPQSVVLIPNTYKWALFHIEKKIPNSTGHNDQWIKLYNIQQFTHGS